MAPYSCNLHLSFALLYSKLFLNNRSEAVWMRIAAPDVANTYMKTPHQHNPGNNAVHFNAYIFCKLRISTHIFVASLYIHSDPISNVIACLVFVPVDS